MTKVKTILAEFCSPKDILAINRLGLLKKEERETQPIPWRHRLPNAERRALVKSEMRMAIRPERSRVNTRDKVKAYETASNPKDSRMGACLYNIHIRGDPSLSSSISKIQRERSRLEASQRHNQQQFVSRSHSLNYEPLLLVERSPSPVVKTRASLMKQHGVDPQTLLKPSYMRPLQAHARTPSTLTTIDSFAAETRKKRNVWEQAMDELEPPKFKSTARPCARLSRSEMQQLRIGHALHKPPRPDAAITTPTELSPVSARKTPNTIGAKVEAWGGDSGAAHSRDDSVFITQQFSIDKRASASDYHRRGITTTAAAAGTGDTSDDGSDLTSRDTGRRQRQSNSKAKTVRFSGVRSASARRPGSHKGGQQHLVAKGGQSGTPSSSVAKKPRPMTVAPGGSFNASVAVTSSRGSTGKSGISRKQGVAGIVGPRGFSPGGRDGKEKKVKKSMEFLNTLLQT